jgi:peptidoglycan hydrolase-like protein with peptidoglycan-binding domain
MLTGHSTDHAMQTQIIDNRTAPFAPLVLQSPQLRNDPVLQDVAANRKTLKRVLGSNAITGGTGPIQDALNQLANADPALLPINLGEDNRNRGIYGPLTEEAVRQFQQVKGLPITGRVDAATLANIDLALLSPATNQPSATDRSDAEDPPVLPDGSVPIVSDKGDPIAHLKERVGRIVTDVPVYKLADRTGYFFRANMAIDVDGSPRAYFPGNRDRSALDTVDDADNAGSSTTYVQGEVRNGKLGIGPNNGFYVSGTSLRLDQPWRCDNFVDAEQIPYIVFPPDFEDVQLGDLAVVVNLQNFSWTHAIFADTNSRVGEASVKTALNLGRRDLNARNGDDDDNYVYLLFPQTKFSAQSGAPHWPDNAIRAGATPLFAKWGGLEQVKRLFPHV